MNPEESGNFHESTDVHPHPEQSSAVEQYLSLSQKMEEIRASAIQELSFEREKHLEAIEKIDAGLATLNVTGRAIVKPAGQRSATSIRRSGPDQSPAVPKRTMTSAGRAAIARAQKVRWAKARAAAAKKVG